MNQKLIDQMQRIERLAQSVTKNDTKDFMIDVIQDILRICDNTLIDHKTSQHLERLEQLNERY